MISCLPSLIRAVQQLRPYKRIEHVTTLLGKYNGQDWKEYFRHQPVVTDLYVSPPPYEYNLQLISLRHAARNMNTVNFELDKDHRYLLRVLQGTVKSKSPDTLYNCILQPGKDVREYFTKNKTFVTSSAESMMIIYSEPCQKQTCQILHQTPDGFCS